MANRGNICGFETGTNPFTVGGSGVSVDAAAARSGNYGLLIVAASGTQATISFSSKQGSSDSTGFCRAYMRFTSFPATARRIMNDGAPANRLLINPDGTITLVRGSNGAVLATSSALNLNQWYRIEMGADIATDRRACKINGSYIGSDPYWFATAADAFPSGSWVIGASDTVAAGFTMHVDDIASDNNDWCGYGKTMYIPVSSLETDHINWSLVGAASKIAAVNDAGGSQDDDTGYILSPLDTTSEIQFGFDSGPTIPTGAVPKAMVGYWRVKRNAGTNNGGNIRLYCGPHAGVAAHNMQDAAIATYATVPGQLQGSGSTWALNLSPRGEQLHETDFPLFRLGLTGSGATNQFRVTQLGIEVEYDDRAGALYDINNIQAISSFEGDTASNFKATNESVAGSFAVSTNQAHTGSQSLRLNSSAVAARAEFLLGSVALGSMSAQFWVRVATRPASTTDLCGICWNAGDTAGYMVSMDSTGAIGYRTTTQTGSMSAANTIPTNTWVEIRLEAFKSSTTSSGDGEFRVWVDGVQIINTAILSAGSISTQHGLVLGGYVSSTVDIYFDDVVVQAGWRAGQGGMLVAALRPTAVAVAGTGFTAVGNADRALAMAESVPDDDTSYLVVPSSTTDVETYTLSDITGSATEVFSVLEYIRAKRDAAANGAVIVGFVTKGATINNSSQAVGATYDTLQVANNLARSFSDRMGRWTPEIINDMTLSIKANDTDVSRITWAMVDVAYSVTTPPVDPDTVVAALARSSIIIC